MRKLKEKNIRKITKMGKGRTVGITLPIEIMERLGWKEHQKVVAKKSGKKIIIEDWEKKKS